MEGVLERIEARYADLTASEKQVAEWLGKGINKVAFQTVSQLANDSRVSEATIIRFARKLGYDNYPALQHDVQLALQRKFSLGDKFHESISNVSQNELLARAYHTEAKNLSTTYDGLDEKTFYRCVSLLRDARRVAVVGFRASYGVAAYLTFTLNLVRPHVSQIQLSLDNIHDQLLDYSNQDVLIAFSLSRPARKTVEVVKEAKQHYGMSILAITDSRFSPLGELGDLVMVAATDGTFNSYTGVMSLCHTLLESVASSLRDSAESRLRQLDQRNTEDVFLR
jgi:DNA-binding MurR/RpiR family transcriptional regulator